MKKRYLAKEEFSFVANTQAATQSPYLPRSVVDQSGTRCVISEYNNRIITLL